MANLKGKGKFSLDFKDFLDYAYKIDELGGSEALMKATENALTKSKEYANNEVKNAMLSSTYSFTSGKKGSQGRSLKSLDEVSKMPLEWDGTTAKGYIGVDFDEVPQVAILMMGSPHIQADTKLRKALKVEGAYRKKVQEIQKAEFDKVLNEVMNND